MLGYENVVHVHMQLGPFLLKSAPLGNLYGYEVVVVPPILQCLQHQAWLFWYKGFRWGIWYSRHAAHAAGVILEAAR